MSAALTVSMAVLVFFYPMLIPTCICIKILSIPVVYYLHSILAEGLVMYFYINLGISRNEYRFIPLVVEFIGFFIVMMLSGVAVYVTG